MTYLDAQLEVFRRAEAMVALAEVFTPMPELEALRRERQGAALCALGYVT